MSRLLFESRAAVLACEAQQALIEKEIELEKLKQQRKPWRGLTDSEKYALSNDVAQRGVPVFEAICEVEAKLKEKNT